MENNLNYSGIEAYCNRFCEKVASQHFESREVITGKEILELQEIRQINLFVIKYLLSEWTREAARIRSPYFNYEDAEVKTALKEFMNILSRHIAIEKDHFLPLLKQATRDTLMLVFSPYDYYMHLVHDPDKQEISLKELKRMSKYVKINSNLLQELIQKTEATGRQKITEQEAGGFLNEIFHNITESPEDVEGYMEKFSRIEPLSENMIYGVSQKQRDTPNITESADLDESDDNEEAKRDDDELSTTINDRHATEKPTLVDIHRKSKIESIRKHISINQRFMFINVLFKGSEDSFNKTIDYLESCEDRESALMFLSSEYPEWENESEEVEEFLELVEKRLP